MIGKFSVICGVVILVFLNGCVQELQGELNPSTWTSWKVRLPLYEQNTSKSRENDYKTSVLKRTGEQNILQNDSSNSNEQKEKEFHRRFLNHGQQISNSKRNELKASGLEEVGELHNIKYNMTIDKIKLAGISEKGLKNGSSENIPINYNKVLQILSSQKRTNSISKNGFMLKRDSQINSKNTKNEINSKKKQNLQIEKNNSITASTTKLVKPTFSQNINKNAIKPENKKGNFKVYKKSDAINNFNKQMKNNEDSDTDKSPSFRKKVRSKKKKHKKTCVLNKRDIDDIFKLLYKKGYRFDRSITDKSEEPLEDLETGAISPRKNSDGKYDLGDINIRSNEKKRKKTKEMPLYENVLVHSRKVSGSFKGNEKELLTPNKKGNAKLRVSDSTEDEVFFTAPTTKFQNSVKKRNVIPIKRNARNYDYIRPLRLRGVGNKKQVSDYFSEQSLNFQRRNVFYPKRYLRNDYIVPEISHKAFRGYEDTYEAFEDDYGPLYPQQAHKNDLTS